MAGRPPAHLTPQVVLLHGFTGAGTAWAKGVTGALTDAGISSVAPDLPGHGASRVRRPSSLSDAIETIDGAVTDTNRGGRRPPVLLGYSMGGRLALHYASLHPDRISGLVLESASPGLRDAAERSARSAADLDLARRIRRIGIKAFSEEWDSHPLFETQRRLPQEVRDSVRVQREASDAEGLACALEAFGTGVLPSLWSGLRTIGVPTLLLAGALDEKFVAIATAMAESLPNVRLHVVGDAGHRVHLEATQPWASVVSSFVTGLPGAS